MRCYSTRVLSLSTTRLITFSIYPQQIKFSIFSTLHFHRFSPKPIDFLKAVVCNLLVFVIPFDQCIMTTIGPYICIYICPLSLLGLPFTVNLEKTILSGFTKMLQSCHGFLMKQVDNLGSQQINSFEVFELLKFVWSSL